MIVLRKHDFVEEIMQRALTRARIKNEIIRVHPVHNASTRCSVPSLICSTAVSHNKRKRL